MKKLILICLCNAALLVSLCLPAEARLIVGLSPASKLIENNQAKIKQLNRELAKIDSAGIKIRGFDDEAAIANWLLRFQEIDAAIVTPDFITKQPAGALKQLTDLHLKSGPSSPLVLVTRSNLNQSQANLIKQAFLALGSNSRGLQLLGGNQLLGITPVGAALQRKVAAPKPAALQPVKKQPLPAEKAKQPEPLQPLQAASKTEVPSPEKELEPAPPAEKPKTAEKTLALKAEPPSREKSKPLAERASKPAPAALEPQEEVKTPEIEAQAEKEPEVKEQPGKPEPAPAVAQPKPLPDKRVILFAVLLLLAAIIFKGTLLILRWQKKKQSAFKAEEAPTIETDREREAVFVPSKDAMSASPEKDLIVETGQLGPGKVPALLKRCADMPEPVLLQVTKGSCEKRVYFAGGQVSGAMTQGTELPESGVRWNKLGNMLVREELISKEERDQGLALLKEEPNLRFGEALLKLGLIDLTGLRHALTRQAKVTIYSLILFPEGRYNILADDGSLPPEESVSLEIKNLIREASSHQSEWTAIRKALPNLNKALNFLPEGRSKLEKVSLSSQQEETLELIDGKKTINDICIESSMMDYEVYRLLYLMVKAKVLE